MCCDDKNLLDDYDEDCLEFDVIDEEIYVYEYYDYDIDEYLAKGWDLREDGFRRGDSDVYQNREYRVFPTRYRLKDYRLTKSLRRVLRKNSDLKTVIRPFRPTEGKDDLYTAHLHARRTEEHPRYTLKKRYEFLKHSQVELMELCVFNGRKFVAGSIFKICEKSVVGDIAFWDTRKTRRSLGIFTVLLEMQYAIQRGKEFYYLGHYFRRNPNYHYKARFPALELYDWDNDTWVDFKDDRIGEMLAQKLRCADDFHKFEPSFYISLIEIAVQCQKDIVGAAVIHRHAIENAEDDWDMHFIILTTDIDYYFQGNNWTRSFSRVLSFNVEERGIVKTMHLKSKNGVVHHFHFAPPEWADFPVKKETRRIVRSGMRILHDPQGILEKLQAAVKGSVKI
jgi:arginine-tRNA-protein transferase